MVGVIETDMTKPTREDLAKNLLRARWLLNEINRVNPDSFDSIYLPFIDSVLESHYGKEELKRQYECAPAAMTEISQI